MLTDRGLSYLSLSFSISPFPPFHGRKEIDFSDRDVMDKDE